MIPKCLITGVSIYDPSEGWRSADLFEMGDMYIINGNLDTCKEAFYEKVVTLPEDSRLWWSRKGVYVIAKEYLTLNQLAQEYIKSGESYSPSNFDVQNNQNMV